MKDKIRRAAAWARRDPEHAAKMIVLPPIVVLTFAVAASHTLEVGDDRAGVTGWKAWSVAGTLEILAAYAFFRAARATGWRRVFPGLVSAACAYVILWINLASVPDYSWRAITANPFPAVYAVGPAVTFLAAAALIEIDTWGLNRRKPQRSTRRPAADRVSARQAGKPPVVRDIRDADRPMIEAILKDIRGGASIPTTRAIKDRFRTSPNRAVRIQQSVKRIQEEGNSGSEDTRAAIRDA